MPEKMQNVVSTQKRNFECHWTLSLLSSEFGNKEVCRIKISFDKCLQYVAFLWHNLFSFPYQTSPNKNVFRKWHFDILYTIFQVALKFIYLLIILYCLLFLGQYKPVRSETPFYGLDILGTLESRDPCTIWRQPLPRTHSGKHHLQLEGTLYIIKA